MGVVVIATLILSISLCVLWVRRCFRVGASSGSVAEKACQGRRSLLSTLTTMIAVGLLHTFFPRNFLAGTFAMQPCRLGNDQSPKPGPLHIGLQAAIQRNIKSAVIHLLHSGALSSERRAIDARNLAPISKQNVKSILTKTAGSQASDTHIRLSQAGTIAEWLGLEQVQQGNLPGALELVWAGILHDAAFKKAIRRRPSYRLYDLFAGLARRSGNESALSMLGHYVRRVWPDDPVLDSRRRKWANVAASWHTRWLSNGIGWKPTVRG